MGVLKRWWPLVASCLLATGCSIVTLGYEFFPSAALWQLESYLPLDSDQRAIASRRFTELHVWHRQKQLPAYAEFVKLQRQQPLTSSNTEQAGKIRQWIVGRWQPIGEKLAPGMSELLVTLTPAQIERVKEQFAKANRKLRNEYLPSVGSSWFGRKDSALESQGSGPAERQQALLKARQAARAERMQKRIEYFLGDLSAEQLKQLRRLSDEQPHYEEIYFTEREARQNRFLALLDNLTKMPVSPADAEQQCKAFLAGLWVSQDATRQARIDETSRLNDQLTARMLVGASAAQQSHYSERLLSWERDFIRMAGLD
jgi:Family of unknown function (DUF6279)